MVGQRRIPGRRARARAARQGGRRSARDPRGAARLRREPRLRRRGPRASGCPSPRPSQLAEAEFGTIAVAGSYTPPPTPGRYRGAGVGPSPAYSYSAAVVEVDVDPETGVTEVEKIWIAHDIGPVHQPRCSSIGQVEGGVYMGLGEALMEEMAYRANRFGVHKIPSMLEYKSPTTHRDAAGRDVPRRGPRPATARSAPRRSARGRCCRSCRRWPTRSTTRSGVRVDEVPITPDKVLRAMGAKDRRYGPKSYPDLRITETMRVKTLAEGGDGTAPRPVRSPRR